MLGFTVMCTTKLMASKRISLVWFVLLFLCVLCLFSRVTAWNFAGGSGLYASKWTPHGGPLLLLEWYCLDIKVDIRVKHLYGEEKEKNTNHLMITSGKVLCLFFSMDIHFYIYFLCLSNITILLLYIHLSFVWHFFLFFLPPFFDRNSYGENKSSYITL